MVFDKYIKDRLHYKENIDLHYAPQHQERPVAFDTDGMHAYHTKLLQENPDAISIGLGEVLTHLYQEGTCYKGASNRVMNHIWEPGTCPIPYTPKKDDPYHEAGYNIHDAGHKVFRPDLLFDGNHTQLNHRLYMICRMMSEAITIIYADMFFVHAVRDKYKTINDRKIHPLFCDINLPIDGKNLIETMYKIMKANVHFCLLGNDASLRKLVDGKSTENLKKYIKKYTGFFIPDYLWTEHNYNVMLQQKDVQQRWFENVKKLSDKYDLKLYSVTQFKDMLNLTEEDGMKMSLEDLVDLVFEYVFKNNVKPFFDKENMTSVIAPNNLTKAFCRYMCNQIAVFAKMSHVPQTKIFEEQIMNELLDSDTKTINKEDIDRIRRFYEFYLEQLVDQNHMTMDLYNTAKELYCHIPPYYISYEEQTIDMKAVANRILTTYS